MGEVLIPTERSFSDLVTICNKRVNLAGVYIISLKLCLEIREFR